MGDSTNPTVSLTKSDSLVKTKPKISKLTVKRRKLNKDDTEMSPVITEKLQLAETVFKNSHAEFSSFLN